MLSWPKHYTYNYLNMGSGVAQLAAQSLLMPEVPFCIQYYILKPLKY